LIFKNLHLFYTKRTNYIWNSGVS